jgi:uncharacterized protein (DUF1697 family)
VLTRWVALLRGINVGTAKRLSMADLRSVFESFGYENVRTVLQSGNVVFDAPAAASVVPSEIQEIERAIAEKTSVSARVVVLSATDFLNFQKGNPLREVSTDPSRGLVTFFERMPDLAKLDLPSAVELAPEQLVIGENAIYQWLPEGILATKLPRSFQKALGPTATARNLRTIERIAGLVDTV